MFVHWVGKELERLLLWQKQQWWQPAARTKLNIYNDITRIALFCSVLISFRNWKFKLCSQHLFTEIHIYCNDMQIPANEIVFRNQILFYRCPWRKNKITKWLGAWRLQVYVHQKLCDIMFVCDKRCLIVKEQATVYSNHGRSVFNGWNNFQPKVNRCWDSHNRITKQQTHPPINIVICYF